MVMLAALEERQGWAENLFIKYNFEFKKKFKKNSLKFQCIKNNTLFLKSISG